MKNDLIDESDLSALSIIKEHKIYLDATKEYTVFGFEYWVICKWLG